MFLFFSITNLKCSIFPVYIPNNINDIVYIDLNQIQTMDDVIYTVDAISDILYNIYDILQKLSISENEIDITYLSIIKNKIISIDIDWEYVKGLLSNYKTNNIEENTNIYNIELVIHEVQRKMKSIKILLFNLEKSILPKNISTYSVKNSLTQEEFLEDGNYNIIINQELDNQSEVDKSQELFCKSFEMQAKFDPFCVALFIISNCAIIFVSDIVYIFPENNIFWHCFLVLIYLFIQFTLFLYAFMILLSKYELFSSATFIVSLLIFFIFVISLSVETYVIIKLIRLKNITDNDIQTPFLYLRYIILFCLSAISTTLIFCIYESNDTLLYILPPIISLFLVLFSIIIGKYYQFIYSNNNNFLQQVPYEDKGA